MYIYLIFLTDQDFRLRLRLTAHAQLCRKHGAAHSPWNGFSDSSFNMMTFLPKLLLLVLLAFPATILMKGKAVLTLFSLMLKSTRA